MRPNEQPEVAEPADDQPEPDDPADTGVPNQQPVFTFPQPQTPGNQVFVPVPQNFGTPGATQPPTGGSQPAGGSQPGATQSTAGGGTP